MDFESLEQLRYETTHKTMTAMAELAADPKAEPADRIAAAKRVDAMSDSLIQAYILTQMKDVAEKNVKNNGRLIDQLKKLDHDEEK